MSKVCGKYCSKKKPQDYILATGRTHNLKYLVNLCCKFLNLKIKWVGKGIKEKAINLEDNSTIVKVNPIFFRPTEINSFKGNFSKARKQLKWQPKTSFLQLVKLMIDADLEREKNENL